VYTSLSFLLSFLLILLIAYPYKSLIESIENAEGSGKIEQKKQ